MNIAKNIITLIKSNLLVVLLILLSAYNTYLVYQLDSALNNKVITLTDKIDSVNITTSGKLTNLENQYSKLANVKNTTVIQKEVQYVQKTDSNDADIELNTVKPNVSVRVNNKDTYKFDLFENEQSKFENGKLVITSASTSNINILTDDYRRSKWSLVTAMNADKKVLGGLEYELGHSVSANVFIGQDIKPYYGLTWRIGDHSKK